MVGGARVFGPRPRNYAFKLNKKLKALARRSALSYKAKENSIVVLEDFTMDTPKTKAFVEILNNLKISEKKVLLVLPEANKNVFLSARNLEGAKLAIAKDINTYSVLDAGALVITERSLEDIDAVLNR